MPSCNISPHNRGRGWLQTLRGNHFRDGRKEKARRKEKDKVTLTVSFPAASSSSTGASVGPRRSQREKHALHLAWRGGEHFLPFTFSSVFPNILLLTSFPSSRPSFPDIFLPLMPEVYSNVSSSLPPCHPSISPALLSNRRRRSR